ncbi:PEP-CTERM sorting domain-containing protein [Nitrosomonas aestuarii]|nr:PEP-CTERM sorting domain-containing protein [Nitrosomonas aestuarii]
MQNKIRLIGLVAVTVCMAMASTVHATYWSLFNIEGESTLSANYVTYASLNDMLTDTNRLGVFQPDPFGFGRNIVGSGSDNKANNPRPMPESPTLVLLGIGLAGFAVARRKKINEY